MPAIETTPPVFRAQGVPIGAAATHEQPEAKPDQIGRLGALRRRSSADQTA
jgi:hypothetical protein